MRLEAIHLLTTYRCTYACDHCFVWGSPEQEATMTLAQLEAVIDQAAAAGCAMVYFEGGEPLLAYPVVLAAARHARAAGLDVGVVTNCFWAESVDDALVWLAPLAEIGIADFALSSYAYFTESLADETHLRNAVIAARRLDLPMSVLEVGAPAAVADLGVACGAPGEIMFKGRAAQALACGERLRRPPDTLTSCPYEDFSDPGRAHVGCDGELQLCQGISAGNVFERPLAELSATLRPERPAGRARDPRRRTLEACPAQRPRSPPGALRRRVPPLLRDTRSPARGGSPSRRARPRRVLRRGCRRRRRRPGRR